MFILNYEYSLLSAFFFAKLDESEPFMIHATLKFWQTYVCDSTKAFKAFKITKAKN